MDFTVENDLLKIKGEALIKHAKLGIINSKDVISQLDILTDCLEIIRWYLFLIEVKFMRALPTEQDKGDVDFFDDSNGSAKVALICVDRSIIAWQNILQLMPESEDKLIEILALLQRIVKAGETIFPNARSYKGAGLDD